jgi:hypothetical protein
MAPETQVGSEMGRFNDSLTCCGLNLQLNSAEISNFVRRSFSARVIQPECSHVCGLNEGGSSMSTTVCPK